MSQTKNCSLLEAGSSERKLFLGKVINVVLLLFFPIWWLVPTVMILGNVFWVPSGDPSFVFPLVIAVAYNVFYPFIFCGPCDGKNALCGPVYSCENGWKCECEPESLTSLPSKHDVGYGLSIWMRVIPAIVVIGVARLVGWIFFPLLSLLALVSGLGILLALAFVVCFVSCVIACVFSD